MKKEKIPHSSNWGLSLNERLHGVKNLKADEGFISFDLLDDDIPIKGPQSESLVSHFQPIGVNIHLLLQGREISSNSHALFLMILQGKSKLELVDPFLYQALAQQGSTFVASEISEKQFKPSSSIAIPDNIPSQQVIYATAFEHAFYIALTTNKAEFRCPFLLLLLCKIIFF